jgi:hypothetical protein
MLVAALKEVTGLELDQDSWARVISLQSSFPNFETVYHDRYKPPAWNRLDAIQATFLRRILQDVRIVVVGHQSERASREPYSCS